MATAIRTTHTGSRAFFYEDVVLHILPWGRPTIDIYTKRLEKFADAYGNWHYGVNKRQIAGQN